MNISFMPRLKNLRLTLQGLTFAVGLSVMSIILSQLFYIFTYGTTLHTILYTKEIVSYPWLLEVFVNQLVSLNSYIYVLLGISWRFFAPIVGAPILEELEFRGGIYLIRNKKSKVLKVFLSVLTTLLFVLCHSVPVGYWFTIGSIGLISCWLVFRTKKLWPSMALHAIYNTLVAFIS